MLQVFLNIAVFGMLPQQAVEAPRLATRSFPDSFWPHPSAPGVLEVERRIPPETRAAPARLGHAVTEWPDWEWRGGAGGGGGGAPGGTPMGGGGPARERTRGGAGCVR